jgi:hypothetical protein
MRRARRNWSMHALRAISYTQGRKAIGRSVSRMRRSADMKISCVRSSARPRSRTIPAT